MRLKAHLKSRGDGRTAATIYLSAMHKDDLPDLRRTRVRCAAAGTWGAAVAEVSSVDAQTGHPHRANCPALRTISCDVEEPCTSHEIPPDSSSLHCFDLCPILVCWGSMQPFSFDLWKIPLGAFQPSWSRRQ